MYINTIKVLESDLKKEDICYVQQEGIILISKYKQKDLKDSILDKKTS